MLQKNAFSTMSMSPVNYCNCPNCKNGQHQEKVNTAVKEIVQQKRKYLTQNGKSRDLWKNNTDDVPSKARSAILGSNAGTALRPSKPGGCRDGGGRYASTKTPETPFATYTTKKPSTYHKISKTVCKMDWKTLLPISVVGFIVIILLLIIWAV